MMEREILIARGENLTMMIKNRKLFYQSLDTHCSEIQDFVLKVYQQVGWAEFWNIEIQLGDMSFKILELGELWDGDLFNFMKYFFGYNFGFQNSVNVSYCVGDFNARWNLPKEQFDIISEKVNNRVLKIDFLGWSKSVLFSSRKVFLYRVSQKIATFQTKIFSIKALRFVLRNWARAIRKVQKPNFLNQFQS